jgi:hypothetical protein
MAAGLPYIAWDRTPYKTPTVASAYFCLCSRYQVTSTPQACSVHVTILNKQWQIAYRGWSFLAWPWADGLQLTVKYHRVTEFYTGPRTWMDSLVVEDIMNIRVTSWRGEQRLASEGLCAMDAVSYLYLRGIQTLSLIRNKAKMKWFRVSLQRGWTNSWSLRIGRCCHPSSLFKVECWSVTNPADRGSWGEGIQESCFGSSTVLPIMHGFTWA